MSIQKWKKKKEKAITEGNLDELFTACSELAELFTEKEDYELALQEYKDAKRAAEAANDTLKVAVSHRMIGEVLSCMMNYESAIKHEMKYLELARSVGSSVEEQRALANLGHMHLLKADTFTNPEAAEKHRALDKATHYSKLSLQASEKLTHINKKEVTEMQARLYLNLGLIVEQRGYADDAANYLKKAVNLCKSQDIWDIMCRAYNSLAGLYQHQSDHPQALEYLDKALAVAQRLPTKNQTTCDLLLIKADILFELPDYRGAKQCLFKAYKLNTDNKNDVEKRLRTVAAVSGFEERLLNVPDSDLAAKKALYESMGDGCCAMKSYSKALEYYYLMLETAKSMGETKEQLKPCFVSLSQTYKDNRQYDMALRYFREELSLYDDNPLEASKTTMNIAETLELKEASLEEVLGAYQEARRLAQAAASLKLEVRALTAVVQVLKENDRISEARKSEVELENLKEKLGPMEPSSESDEETTPDIGAEIRIEELSDGEQEDGPGTDSSVHTRKKYPVTKFKRNEKGEYPLHTACINGNLALVKKLLDQKHPVNCRDHNGWLPLHEACNYGHLEIVEELLSHGATINDKGSAGCDGMTPLLDAACNGCLGVMRLLLDKGASPLMRTNSGETALDCLMAWRQRYIQDEGRDLDQETLSDYNDLVRTLRAALKKAGHKPDSERRSPSPVSQPKSRRHSPLELKNTNSLNHTRHASVSSTRNSFDDDPPRKSFSEKEKIVRTTSLRRNSCENFPSQSTGARKEYEEAMKALRHKPALASPPSPPTLDSRGALVTEDQVVDDWLVDDLGVNSNTAANRGIKRRRPHMFEDQPQRRPNRLTSPDRSSRVNGYRPVSPVQLMQSDSSDSDLLLAMDVVEQTTSSSSPTEVVAAEPPQTQHQLSLRQRLANSHQTKLPTVPLVAPPVTEVSPPPVVGPPCSQHHHVQPSQHLANTQVAPPSIKVRVLGKLLLIPLPVSMEDPPTIAWLAEEAARRYYSFEGMEPKLSIEAEDGAMLSPQDPVTILLSYREVNGIVTSWRQHPITERYRAACTETDTVMDEYLERSLDVCQASLSLGLEGCALDAVVMEPVFRVLIHETSLQQLNLSDNRLGDVGMQSLSKLVVKLVNLRELDLTCNGITISGLTMLVHQMVEHQACKRLEILRLSHNHLGQSCLSLLGQLTTVARALTSLSLTAVGITSASFRTALPLQSEILEQLEIGHNVLGSEGVATLLQGLSVERVVRLDLSHTGPGVPRALAQWLTSGPPRSLRYLNIAYCADQREDFDKILRCLEDAPSLEHLELTPPGADPAMLEALYRLPLQVLRLPGVMVPRLPPQPPPINEFSCLSLSSARWSHHGPFALVTNNPCPSVQ